MWMQVSDMFLDERVKSEFGPTPVVSDEGSGHHAASNKQDRAHVLRSSWPVAHHLHFQRPAKLLLLKEEATRHQTIRCPRVHH